MASNVLSLTFDRATLARELSLAVASVEKKTTIPILGNVLLDGSGDRLSILATDLEVALTTGIPAKIASGGRATIPAKRFLDYVKLLPDGDVSLSISEAFWASIKSGRAKTRIAGMSPDSFPELPAAPDSVTPIPALGLARMIRRTMQGVPREASRFTLNGSLLQVTDEEFVMVATDGHRLAYASIPGGGKSEKAIIPAKALREIEKLATSLSGDAEIRVSTDLNHLFFAAGTRALTARRLTGNFPDYERVFPQAFKGSATFSVADLTSALTRSRLAADERSTSVKLALKGKEITLSAMTDTSESTEVVPVESAGPDVDFGMNANYVLEALSGMETDQAIVRYNDANSAFLWEPTGTGAEALGTYKVIIMPMRI